MKRGGPLGRSGSLKRRTPLRARGNTSYRKRERFIDYMLFVKRLPCAARSFADTCCAGPVEADHAGRRGIGQKAHDLTCIPLCQKHHRERTNLCGAFAGWRAERMRAWLDTVIESTQAFKRGMLPAVETSERGPAKHGAAWQRQAGPGEALQCAPNQGTVSTDEGDT